MRRADEPPHLLVYELGRGLAERLLHQRLAWPWEIEGHLAQLLAHPELHDLQRASAGVSPVQSPPAPPPSWLLLYLGIGALGDLSQVVLGPRGDPPEE